MKAALGVVWRLLWKALVDPGLLDHADFLRKIWFAVQKKLTDTFHDTHSVCNIWKLKVKRVFSCSFIVHTAKNSSYWTLFFLRHILLQSDPGSLIRLRGLDSRFGPTHANKQKKLTQTAVARLSLPSGSECYWHHPLSGRSFHPSRPFRSSTFGMNWHDGRMHEVCEAWNSFPSLLAHMLTSFRWALSSCCPSVRWCALHLCIKGEKLFLVLKHTLWNLWVN